MFCVGVFLCVADQLTVVHHNYDNHHDHFFNHILPTSGSLTHRSMSLMIKGEGSGMQGLLIYFIIHLSSISSSKLQNLMMREVFEHICAIITDEDNVTVFLSYIYTYMYRLTSITL